MVATGGRVITERQAYIESAKKQLEQGTKADGRTDPTIQAWALMDIAESLAEIRVVLNLIARKLGEETHAEYLSGEKPTSARQ